MMPQNSDYHKAHRHEYVEVRSRVPAAGSVRRLRRVLLNATSHLLISPSYESSRIASFT